MADSKLSALTELAVQPAASDEFYVNDGGTSKRIQYSTLLNGQTLVMHFLGKVDQVAQSISNEIVEQYESVVRTRDFAKLLNEGCGPDCGSGGACTNGSCAGCVGSNGCSSDLG